MTTRRGTTGRVWRALAGTEAAPADKPDNAPAAPAPRRLEILVAGARAVPGFGGESRQVTNLTVDQGKQRWDEVAVRAGSVAALRRALPWLALAGRTRRLLISVAVTARPDALHVPAVVGRRVPAASSCHRTESAAVEMSVGLDKHTEVGMIARAVLDAGRPAVSRTARLRVGLTAPSALPWAAGDPLVTAAVQPVDAEVPAAYDVLVGPAGPTVDPRVPRCSAGLPPVDTAMCSPRGFGPAGPHIARWDADGTLRWDGGECRPDPWVGLSENDVAALRALRAVRAADGVDAALLAQACCAGIPVASRDPALEASLGTQLAPRLRALDPMGLSDDVARESWSIDTRRLALAAFAPRAHWANTAARLGVPAGPAPTVSVLLATRRPALLPFALAQIARQDWADLQVVLVLHGADATDPAVTAALETLDRPVDIVAVPDEVVFGRALNLGLDRCAGELVTKFDDDDWYGPRHVTDLVQAREHSGAVLVGCGGYHVYLARPDVTIRWTHVPTEALTTWVHGGTILLSRGDLQSLGGFAAVPVGEDAALLATVRAAGGGIYGIHDLGFCYYRGRDHTWAPAGGDTRWLETDAIKLPGFQPPPQLDPLPHPWAPST